MLAEEGFVGVGQVRGLAFLERRCASAQLRVFAAVRQSTSRYRRRRFARRTLPATHLPIRNSRCGYKLPISKSGTLIPSTEKMRRTSSDAISRSPYRT